MRRKEKTAKVTKVYKPGRWLEKLIESIERQANEREGVTVQSPAYLMDKVTGDLREFDVLITIKTGHHDPILMALECRDRSRPVGAPEVEAFVGKCRDAGVNQGIIVSAKGFAVTAREKAKHHNIGCFELAQAERFGWCNVPGIFGCERKPKQIRVTKIEVDETRGAPKGKLTLLYQGNEEIKDEVLTGIASHLVMSVALDRDFVLKMPSDHVYTEKFQDINPDFAAIDAHGHAFRVKRIELDLEYMIKVIFTPFQWHTYSNASGEVVKETATADLVIAGQTINVVAISNPGELGPNQVVVSHLAEATQKPRKKKARAPKTRK